MIWRKKPPEKINMYYGYRTTRSMKNKATWDFAHEYIGKIWPLIGIILLIFSLPWPIIFRNRSEDALGILVIVIIGVQLAGLILSIILTEISLRKNFDENGQKND